MKERLPHGPRASQEPVLTATHIDPNGCSGANDFFFDPNITGQTVANLIDGQIQQLRDLGARRFLLASYPNLGTIPVAAITASSENLILSNQTMQLRSATQDLVKKYQNEQLDIDFVDVYSLFQSIVHNPRKYGVDPAYLHSACLRGVYPSEGVPLSVCEDPEKHILWDIYHPTARMHGLVARLFESVLGKKHH